MCYERNSVPRQRRDEGSKKGAGSLLWRDDISAEAWWNYQRNCGENIPGSGQQIQTLRLEERDIPMTLKEERCSRSMISEGKSSARWVGRCRQEWRSVGPRGGWISSVMREASGEAHQGTDVTWLVLEDDSGCSEDIGWQMNTIGNRETGHEAVVLIAVRTRGGLNKEVAGGGK